MSLKFHFFFFLDPHCIPKSSIPNHVRTPSLDHRMCPRALSHTRTPSLDLRHTRTSSADLNKLFRNEVGMVFGSQQGNLLYTC